MSKRKVFGRLRNVETTDGVYTFEMRETRRNRKSGEIEQQGGVYVRRRNSQKVRLLDFNVLANGCELEKEVLGNKMKFVLDDQGVLVKRAGSKASQRIPFEELVNAAQRQPMLFAEFLEKKKEE